MSSRTFFTVLLSLSLLSCGRFLDPNYCVNEGFADQSCIRPAGIVSVLVSPANATVSVGQTLQLSAKVTLNAAPVLTAVVWSTSDVAAASVDSTGRVLGKAVSDGVAICAIVGATSSAPAENCATVIVHGAPPNLAVVSPP